MRKSEIIAGVIAFVLTILLLGAIGGIDQERMTVKEGALAILGISVALVAEYEICYRLEQRRRRKRKIKLAAKKEESFCRKKGA